MNRKLFFVVAGMFILSILVACTRPVSKSPNAVPSAAVTQAVQTVFANLTVTPAATKQPVTAFTPTQVKPTEPAPTGTSEPPTGTARPAVTATPGVTTPSATLNPLDPLAGLGNPDWHEGFSDSGSWYTFQDEFVNFASAEGKLEMLAYQASNRNGWALAPQLVSNKYYVEMTGTFGDACKGADHYGLMLSPTSSADQGYLFGISCDGKYVLWNWNGTRMTALVKWTAAGAIQSGPNKTNRIGIKGEGNKLSLYANGFLLTELTDKSYEPLYFGVFLGAVETQNFLVKVSSLNYWKLP